MSSTYPLIDAFSWPGVLLNPMAWALVALLIVGARRLLARWRARA